MSRPVDKDVIVHHSVRIALIMGVLIELWYDAFLVNIISMLSMQDVGVYTVY